jgi:galactose-1-phosphate uridylyltransferase
MSPRRRETPVIELRSVTERTRLVDPGGTEIEQVVEHRVDPLTGTVASLNTALGAKAKAFLGRADLDLLRDVQERSRQNCPFCSASEKGTRFQPGFAEGGLIRVGRSLAVPNLFAKCAVDSVVIVDHAAHVLFPTQLPEASLATAIQAAVEVVRRARAQDPALVHHVVGMNFLQPSGSSVPHPHLQAHVRSVPYSTLARWERLAAEFLARTGQPYWRTLLDEERAAGSRHVGVTGRVEWLCPWAPAHQKEVWGVLPAASSLAEIGEDDAAAFAAGIARVVADYEEGGIHPFTFAFCSSPSPGGRAFALHVRVCARPAFQPLYANYDTWFTPKFLGEDVHVEAPETLAARLRARF